MKKKQKQKKFKLLFGSKFVSPGVYQIFPDSRKMESKESTSFYAEFFFAQNHKERRRGRRKEAAAEEQETEAEDNDDDEDEDVQANLLQSEDFYHQQSCTDAQNSGSALCSNCKKKKKLSLLWRSFVWLSYRILKPCPSRGVKVEGCSSSPLPLTPSCACRRSLYLAAVATVVLVVRFLHNNCKRQQEKTTHRDHSLTYSFDWNSKCHAPPDPGNTLDLCTHLLMCWSLQVNMLFPAMSAFHLLLKKLQHLRRNYLRRRHNEPYSSVDIGMLLSRCFLHDPLLLWWCLGIAPPWQQMCSLDRTKKNQEDTRSSFRRCSWSSFLCLRTWDTELWPKSPLLQQWSASSSAAQDPFGFCLLHCSSSLLLSPQHSSPPISSLLKSGARNFYLFPCFFFTQVSRGIETKQKAKNVDTSPLESLIFGTREQNVRRSQNFEHQKHSPRIILRCQAWGKEKTHYKLLNPLKSS